MNRIQIIQKYIDKYGYKSYLEIGVQAGHCFAAINCEIKVGVDPDTASAATIHKTSDEFFQILNTDYTWLFQGAKEKPKFDIIFIDGLHHAEQVEKDIINSLACLSEGGTILMHDCKPESEFMQLIPLTTQNEWTGDTWKAYVKMRMTREDLSMRVVNTDWGVGIIRIGSQEKLTIDVPINYENFKKNEDKWLNLVSVQTFWDSMQ